MNQSCCAVAAVPPLQVIDGEQEQEGNHQHDDGQRGGAGVVELVQLVHDQQRDNLRLHRDVAGDENDRAVFAEGARERQREAGEQRGHHHRQDDAPEGFPAVRAEGGGGLLDFNVEFLQHRLDRADDKRQSDERERDKNAQARVGDFDSKRREPPAHPAVFRIDRRERNARHRRRQRERQIHQRVHETPAPELIAHQHPRDEQAEDQIRQRGEKRDAKAQAERRQRGRRGDRVPELRPRERRRLAERRRQRNEHDQPQIKQGVAERQFEARQHLECFYPCLSGRHDFLKPQKQKLLRRR